MNWRIEMALGASDIGWYIETIKRIAIDPIEGMDSSTLSKTIRIKTFLAQCLSFKRG